MKKRGKFVIKINLSNRWLYTFIVIGILIAVGFGVYAVTYSASGAGHPYTELSSCGANQTLKMNAAGTAWTCADAITKEYADLNYKDPPGQWTCTLRTSSGSGSRTVSCVSPEKVITGGCTISRSYSDYIYGYPRQDGWGCSCLSSSLCGTTTAYAYCCL